MGKNNGQPKLDLSRVKHKETPVSMKEAPKDVIPIDWVIPIKNRIE